MNIGLFWTIATYVCSIFVVVGIYKSRVDTLQDRVVSLENSNKSNEIQLTSIQVQLADIQAKLELLLTGKSLKE